MIFIALNGNSASTIFNPNGIATATYDKVDCRRADSDITLGSIDFVFVRPDFVQIYNGSIWMYLLFSLHQVFIINKEHVYSDFYMKYHKKSYLIRIYSKSLTLYDRLFRRKYKIIK
jgi:hypothetical protein